MIEIWHMGHDWSADDRSAASYASRADGFAFAAFCTGRYTHVASVDTDDLETAFRLTNNIDSSWSFQADPRVTVRAPFPRRRGDNTIMGHKSTEMGDIAVIDGVLYRCAVIGWTKIEGQTNG